MFSGQCCKKFLLSSLEPIVLLSIIVICFAKFKSRCLYDTRGFSFLQATPITVSLYLHNLLETSLSSSTIHAARRAISWVHKFAGFEDFNPCEMFLLNLLLRLLVVHVFLVSLSGRQSPLPRRSSARFSNIMGKVVICLISGLSVCVSLYMPVFSVFLSF